MLPDKLKLWLALAKVYIRFTAKGLARRLAAWYHCRTYRLVPNPRNVVVVGGSFAGVELVRRLAETLPTGYRAVLVEQNSHLNYLFAFPRFSVLEGLEQTAFIPYDGIVKSAPKGIFQHVRGPAVNVTDSQIHLASSEVLDYEYLVVATGSSQPTPAKLKSTDRDGACRELRDVQQAIKKARSIAVVGAGAVGVELASDAKDIYPDKSVTLIHSRDQLLNSFGRRLHEYVMEWLVEHKVRVLLGERPDLPRGQSMFTDQALTFADGRTETFDLVRPNSGILAGLLPDAISPIHDRILVRPTLEVASQRPEGKEAGPHRRVVFALGDVADHSGPRMARAAFGQAEVVADNIASLARGKPAARTYVPRREMEGCIVLTLGRASTVVYLPAARPGGDDVLLPRVEDGGYLDLGAAKAWAYYGAEGSAAGVPAEAAPGAAAAPLG